MEIEKNLSKKNTFAELSVGDVFIWDGVVYMVIEEDFGLGEDRPYVGYAVALDTGCIYGFDNEKCTKVSAKLTVTN